jgi:hypothetical protein
MSIIMFLVLLESLWWIRVHWGAFVTFNLWCKNDSIVHLNGLTNEQENTYITIQSKPYDQTHIWNILLAMFFELST